MYPFAKQIILLKYLHIHFKSRLYYEERERGGRKRERTVKYEIRNTSHIIIRSCGTPVAAMTRANNHVDVILWALAYLRLYEEHKPAPRGPRVCTCVDVCARYTYTRENVRVWKRATPRNARVAPMAVNATRLERSRLRNAVPSQTQRQPRLSATVRRNKNAGWKGGKEERENGPRPEPPGALYHRGRKTRCRSAPCRR